MKIKGRTLFSSADEFSFKNVSKNLSFICVCSLVLLSCQVPTENAQEFLDRKTLDELRLEQNDSILTPSEVIPPPKKTPPKTKFGPYVENQKKLASIFHQKVSISIGEQLPVKTALLSLSQQTGVNLQLDPSIDMRLIYSAHEQPFIDVIEGICELADLRYTIEKTNLRIVPDSPYPENYKIQFLNLNRSTENNTSISTNVFSSLGDTKQVDNGSNTNVTAKTDNNFWAELEENLFVILGENDQTKNADSYTIHRQGGILTVRATSRQHKLIESYLYNLKRAISTQVLIEAKIVEVTLKDEFKAGINWKQVIGGNFRTVMMLGKIAEHAKITDPLHHQDILSIGTDIGNFSGILHAIQQFGACKTLSSPRVTVLNNQNAILKVAQNQVYFRLRYDRENNTNINRESVMVTSDIQTVPIGLVMSVQPSIDPDGNRILLSLRPTISRLTRSVADPAVDLLYSLNGDCNMEHIKPSLIPVVEVREIDSVLEVDSGYIAILGGLMESRKAKEDTKLPGFGDIPLLGKLVSAKSEVDEVVELVILLKATIVDQDDFSGQIKESDRQLLSGF